MLDCLACLRNPDHELQDEGETIAAFCETHWQEFEARLSEVGADYRAMIRGGMHPKMAERALVVWMHADSR
jgi:hypothetical protein